MKLRKIEIIENDSNRKGDLFGRLMGDLFHSIGYDEVRLNIHKSGREIDLETLHRTEKKIAIAECKAHVDKTGGDEINKFIGALDAEKNRIRKTEALKGFDAIGYFISLSGFKETAIEQENNFDNQRVILIKPEKIVEELIKGKIIISIEDAILAVAGYSSNLHLMEYVDLFAYEKGWVWVIYMSDSNKQLPSHFGLVHAGGKPLIDVLAQEMIMSDGNKNLNGLIYVHEKERNKTVLDNIQETQKKYFKYLENELGEIRFEGISTTDKEVVESKVKLENIFIPLHLLKTSTKEGEPTQNRKAVGEILKENTRLAILAKPGGGKSTLIKRIAISYAFPERRKEINDSLPDRPWFPIFLRCRELGEMVKRSITDIINFIPNRAEINFFQEEFSYLVSNSLQNGNALLLIDGLDEISEDKNRIAFVNQLRTFIATYPSINIIVTSREAGFRIVGGSLATYCEHYVVSKLIDTEIEELTIKWHKCIIDDTLHTLQEAKKLSNVIIEDNRINELATNPLLLTTLLFVKRWAGYLPTKRSVLYHEMIKLLLVTWNVEGHDRLDIDEAEPQLAFVAFWMTKNKLQTITEEELSKCLIDARKQMPEILGYTTISPFEFIKRVELRSSLLIMSGHTKNSLGQVTQVYEFLHLSFQEYLTAKAIAKGYLPFNENNNKLDVIKTYVYEENWKEVIPLAAVLLEREAKDLIIFLIEECKQLVIESGAEDETDTSLPQQLLGNCLANEVQITPDLLEKAIEWYSKSPEDLEYNIHLSILKSKFGNIFRNKVRQIFFDKYEDKTSSRIGSILGEIYFAEEYENDDETFFLKIYSTLKTDDAEKKCITILGLMIYSYYGSIGNKVMLIPASINEIFNEIYNLLVLNKKNEIYLSICWCIIWCEDAKIFSNDVRQKFVEFFVESWLKVKEYNLKRFTAWLLSQILRPDISNNTIIKLNNIADVLNEAYKNSFDENERLSVIYLLHICRLPIDVNEVSKILSSVPQYRRNNALMSFVEKMNIALDENN